MQVSSRALQLEWNGTYEHQIHDTFLVRVVTKVFMVATRETSSDTVVLVHHTGNTVESEPVELELLHPVAKITEQEPDNFVRPVVEEATVPEIVPALSSFVEVKVVGPIELVETVQDVLARMRVHNIEEDSDTQSMGRVDQFFEFFRGSVSRARREEARNLVSEG